MNDGDLSQGHDGFEIPASSTAARHAPVLLEEVLQWVVPAGVDADAVIVDATVGLGGHAEALLERYEAIRYVGVDRDPRALKLAGERLKRFGSRVTLIEGRHEELFEILDKLNVGEIGAVLADLGVSSMQIDEPSRGFSFRFDGPLDMRMSAEGSTAADLVNTLDEYELTRIIRDFGEEPMAKRIAQAIVALRETEPITTTRQLAQIVRDVKRGVREKIDAATLTFQALRIATNEEIVRLEEFVDQAVARLASGGRIGVISFHSLEDRVIKRALRRLQGECKCPPDLPVCGCGMISFVQVLTSRPLTASTEEETRNPRARSARLRVAEKL